MQNGDLSWGLDRPLDDHARRASGKSLMHEIVAVVVLAVEGEKQVAGLHRPRIDNRAGEGAVRRAVRSDEEIGRSLDRDAHVDHAPARRIPTPSPTRGRAVAAKS